MRLLPTPSPQLQRALASATACLLIGGCTQWQAAAGDTVRSLIPHGHPADQAPLRASMQYLRVSTNDVPSLLVLGDIDRDADGRPVQVWYSAGREVLRLQGGRLVGLTGTPVEWRSVTLPHSLPTWPQAQATVQYERLRDEMPGDHIGVREIVSLRSITAPSQHHLQQLDAATLQWFEETTALPADTPAALAASFNPLPPARYALRHTPTSLVPVYGEQCLRASLCIQWQIWPPTPPQP